MAYARRSTRRASGARKSPKRRAPARRVARRSNVRRGSTRKRASSGAGRSKHTVRIEVVQAAPPALSPVTQALMDARKVIPPKKAKF